MWAVVLAWHGQRAKGQGFEGGFGKSERRTECGRLEAASEEWVCESLEGVRLGCYGSYYFKRGDSCRERGKVEKPTSATGKWL